MNQRVKTWGKFILRWGIAVGGITWVVMNLHLRDRVTILDDADLPVEVQLYEPAMEGFSTVKVFDPQTGAIRDVDAKDLVNQAAEKHVNLIGPDGKKVRADLLATDLTDRLDSVERLLVRDPKTGEPTWIPPSQTDYQLNVPRPLVEPGLIHMVREANPVFLWAAILVFPASYVVTSIRWHLLMRALEISISMPRAFVLNMVGAFYNTFMPGSTGGDLLKAYYASKHTIHRMRAVMSVLIDRVLGLIALIVLGGVAAALQWENRDCRRVAIACGAILACAVIGLVVFYTPVLRRFTGLDFILRRLPMQKQVRSAVETLEIYGRRPWLALAATIMSFPVHMITVISAIFAGHALNLPIEPMHYWAVVPIIVLSGSLPISPQGAGVMEFFAIQLTKSQGTTIAQAFALTMSIRIVGILWNLTGGVFVLKGSYHAPTAKEQESMEEDEAAPPSPPGFRIDESASATPSAER